MIQKKRKIDYGDLYRTCKSFQIPQGGNRYDYCNMWKSKKKKLKQYYTLNIYFIKKQEIIREINMKVLKTDYRHLNMSCECWVKDTKQNIKYEKEVLEEEPWELQRAEWKTWVY